MSGRTQRIVAIALTCAAGVLGARIPAAFANPIAPPNHGMYLGAFVDPNSSWDGVTRQEGEVKTFEHRIGRKLSIDNHYVGWTGSSQMFPNAIMKWDVRTGRIPMISWEGTNLSVINSGSQDASIRARALALKRWGHRVFISWGYEMNGNWNSWDGTHNNSSGQTNGPKKYVAAWRRIHNIFDQVGAHNVAWVWTVNDGDVPSASWNHWANYYPGDAYVDWVGIDGYNWGNTTSWSTWRPFGSLFTNVYRDYSRRKPIMVVETGTVDTGGDKTAWIRGMWRSLEYEYRDMRAVVWMERGGWRVETSGSAVSAFRAMATSPYLEHRADVGAPVLSQLSASRASGGTREVLSFHLSEPARVSIRIRNGAGLIVRTLFGTGPVPSGPHTASWNLRNAGGVHVRPGKYRWAVRAVDPWGNARTVVGSFQVG